MTDTDTKEKPDLVKQMSSVVSHEIRNPLAIISNSLYFIKTKLGASGAPLDPKIAKHLGVIESEVRHSNEIIEEMLSYTRKRELQPAPISLNGIMDEQAGAYAVPANVTLKTVDDPADPRVNADKDAVCYALRCVLSNAVHALPEGGVITLACTHDDKRAHITVTDGGPGFPGGDGEKAFEPFYTTRPRGMGLGLSIARKFLELHGGAVTAANAPGGGARVTLSLPILK